MPHAAFTAAFVAIGVIAAAVYYIYTETQSNENAYRYDERIYPAMPDLSYGNAQSTSSSRRNNHQKPRRRRSISSNCSICCDALTSSLVAVLSCPHEFHENCIRRWWREASRLTTNSGSCPLCRQSVVILQILRR